LTGDTNGGTENGEETEKKTVNRRSIVDAEKVIRGELENIDRQISGLEWQRKGLQTALKAVELKDD